MKTKRHIIALVVSLVLVIVAAFTVGCTAPKEEDKVPKSYSFEGVLHGEKDMPAFLELKEDGSVKLEYIMTMGNPNATAHTKVTDEGSWTQDDKGVITSVKLVSNGDTYDAAVSAEKGTITIGYSMDFTTFTVSVAEVSEQGRNFTFMTEDKNPKSYSLKGILYGEKEMPAFLELKEDGSVQLDYIMTMGNSNATAHTKITDEGSWTKDAIGRIGSVTLKSNGDDYTAVINHKAGTITIGYSMDFTTFTVSVSDVTTGEGAKIIVISMEDAA